MVQWAPSRLRPVHGARSSRVRAAAVPLVLLPPPLSVRNGHAPRLGSAPRGVRVRHTARRGAARPPRRVIGGARALRDARRGCTWSWDLPSHAQHARRARGWRARATRRGGGRPGGGVQRRIQRHRPKSRASRREALYSVLRPTQSRPACSARAWWACSDAPLGPRGGIQRTVRLHPVLWVSRPSGVLGWLSWVRRASRSGTRGAGRRESHFGGRHRTSCYRVRCWRGGAPFWASRRGTRHPDIGSRPFGAVFIWIRGRSCIDRSSSRGPLHARPAALCRHRARSAPTRSGARGPRAVLADAKCLWWRARLTAATRRPRRGLGP